LEFTGLEPSENLKDVCFDDEQLRHLKKKKTVEMYDVYQVGLTFVEKHQKKTYEFYLMKDKNKSRCIMYVDNCCLKHMANSGVDLNLVAQKGISYMNKKEFDLMVKEAEFSRKNEMELPKDNEELDSLCTEINSKIFDSEKQGEFVERDSYAYYMPSYYEYRESTRFEVVPKNDYLIKAVMQKYGCKNDWFVIKTKNAKNQKVVRFVKLGFTSDSRNKKLMLQEINKLRGFSQVINLLIEYKPVVFVFSGMLDLYYIYSKFIDTIPENVDDFKRGLHKAFPIVYDLAYIVRNKDLKDKFKSKSLEGVYKRVLENPNVVGDAKLELKKPHTAGYDSYVTAVSAIWVVWYRKIELKELNSKNMLFKFRGPSFSIVPQDYEPIKRKRGSDVFFVFVDLTSVPRSKIIEQFKKVGDVKFVPNDKKSCFVQVRNFDYHNYSWSEFVKNVLSKKVLLWPSGRQHIIDELNKIKV
jgi:hypothetical protein